MAVVYLAVQYSLDREVAIKIITPAASSDEAQTRRFEHEARIIAKLEHPGIVGIHEVGRTAEGQLYYVMPYLARGDLSQRDYREHEAGIVDLLRALLGALGYAHARGIVHRDVKAENVLFNNADRPQLTDFGIALTRGRSNARITGAGIAVGSGGYMSPEQARGEPVDARADVFALGGLLAAVLVGRAPFRGTDVGNTVSLAAAGDTSSVLADLSACRADAELVGIVRRCLAPAAADRPADGTAVAALMAEYRAGVEERLRAAERERAAAAARAVEQRKRRRVQLALAAAVALLVAGGATAVWWKDAHDRDSRELTLKADRLEAERQADNFRHKAEAERADADRRVAQAHRDQEVAALLADAETAVRASDAGRAGFLLRQIGDADVARLGPATARLERCRADLRLLPELDRVEDIRWQVQGSKYRKAEAAAAVAKVLAALGIEPGRTPPAEAAAAAGASLASARLVTELTWWVVSARDDPVMQAALRDALARLDPDEFRVAARAAVVDRRWTDVAAMLGRANEAGQPAWFVAAVASVDAVDPTIRAAATETALRRTPGDFPALMILGQLDLPSRSGTAARRARACQAAVALRPGTAAGWYNLGAALRDGGDPTAALSAFDTAVRLAPSYAAAHTGRGTALAALGDRDAEAAAYQAALAADPGYAPAHNNLAAVRAARAASVGFDRLPTGLPIRLVNLAAAEAGFARAVELQPGYSAALCGLGDVWRARGRPARAVGFYRQAIAAAPGDPAGHLGFGFSREAEQDWPGAVAAFQQAVADCPWSAAAHYFLARALARDGRLAEGRDLLRTAVRLDPRYADAHVALASQLEEKSELEGALEHYLAALAAAPGRAEAAAGRDRVRARLAGPKS